MQIPTLDAEPATLAGALWLQVGGKGAWHRRHAVLKANLLFWYSDTKDAAAPTPLKPLGCACIEGLRVQPLEPPPADPQLSGLGMPMSLVPMVDAPAEVNWCAESEDEARAWLQALQTSRHAVVVHEKEMLGAQLLQQEERAKARAVAAEKAGLAAIEGLAESEATESALRAELARLEEELEESARETERERHYAAQEERAAEAARRACAALQARCAASEGALRQQRWETALAEAEAADEAAPPPAAAPDAFTQGATAAAVAAAVAAAAAAGLIVEDRPLRGGFGAVYTNKEKTAVLKFVPRATAAPSLEAQLATQLSVPGRGHPNVAEIAEIGSELGVTDGAVEVFKMPLYPPLRHLSAAEVHDGLRAACGFLWASGWAYIDLKAENVRLAEATTELPRRAVLIDLDCVPRTADGGCAVGALAGLINARGTAGWRAPDVVDLLLRDDASTVLTKDEADEVLARQVTWGAGLIRLRLEAAERSRPGAERLIERLLAQEDPPVPSPPPDGAGADGDDAALPASWLDGVPPLYRTARGVADHIWLERLCVDTSLLTAVAARPPPAGSAAAALLDDVIGDEVFEALREGAAAPPPPLPTVREFVEWAEGGARGRARTRTVSDATAAAATPGVTEATFQRRRTALLLAPPADGAASPWPLTSRNALELRLRGMAPPADEDLLGEEKWMAEAFDGGRDAKAIVAWWYHTRGPEAE